MNDRRRGMSVSLALSALLVLGAARVALAADNTPLLIVDYRPPILSLSARGVSIEQVLHEIGAVAGFSVVGDASEQALPSEIVIRDTPLEEALRQLLRGENHLIVYGRARDAASASAVAQILLLGRPSSSSTRSDSAQTRVPVQPRLPASDASPAGPGADPLASAAAALQAAADATAESDGAGITLDALLRTSALAGVRVDPTAAGAETSPAPPTSTADLASTLAEATRRAQQSLAALVSGLAAATASLRQSTQDSQK